MKAKQFLLHVGYAKAGSSLTGDWFVRNPAICFSDFAIGGLKNTTELIALANEKPENHPVYHVVRDMIFTIPRIEDVQSLEGGVKAYQKRVCDTLASLFPQAKVLIVTRGYESMLASNYSQFIKEGGALKAEEIVQYGAILAELFDYNYLIRTYCEAFGKENVIVLPFELLKEDVSGFFKQIEERLDLPHFEFKPKVVNPSLQSSEAASLRRKNTLYNLVATYGGSLGKKAQANYIEKRRVKAFDWDTDKLSASQPEAQKALVQIDETLVSMLKKNSAVLKEYPVFEPYLTHYQ